GARARPPPPALGPARCPRRRRGAVLVLRPRAPLRSPRGLRLPARRLRAGERRRPQPRRPRDLLPRPRPRRLRRRGGRGGAPAPARELALAQREAAEADERVVDEVREHRRGEGARGGAQGGEGEAGEGEGGERPPRAVDL